MIKAVDRIGEKHGQLTIISLAGINKNQRTIANCLCDCGREKAILIDALVRKDKPTKSCGHLQIENRAQIFSFNMDPWPSEYKRWIKTETRNIEIKLSFEEWKELVSANCFYCGQEPNQSCHNGQKVMKNGIDRKNPELSYVLENCVPCCGKCNYSKWTMTYEDFLTWIKRVNAHLFQTTDAEKPE